MSYWELKMSSPYGDGRVHDHRFESREEALKFWKTMQEIYDMFRLSATLCKWTSSSQKELTYEPETEVLHQ